MDVKKAVLIFIGAIVLLIVGSGLAGGADRIQLAPPIQGQDSVSQMEEAVVVVLPVAVNGNSVIFEGTLAELAGGSNIYRLYGGSGGVAAGSGGGFSGGADIRVAAYH